MPPRAPLLGYNNNIPHRGKMYHVQTEDSGARKPHLVTHLFADGGRIVHTTKTPYTLADDPGALEALRKQMKDQHRAMVDALRSGQLDPLIEAASAPPVALRASKPPPSRSKPPAARASKPPPPVRVKSTEPPPVEPDVRGRYRWTGPPPKRKTTRPPPDSQPGTGADKPDTLRLGRGVEGGPIAIPRAPAVPAIADADGPDSQAGGRRRFGDRFDGGRPLDELMIAFLERRKRVAE